MKQRHYRTGRSSPSRAAWCGVNSVRIKLNRYRPWALASAAAWLLGACGGDGGVSDTPPPQTYAVQAAMGHLLTQTGSWTMTGSGSDGLVYTISMAFAPLPPAPFLVGGTVAARSVLTLGSVNGSATLTYYLDAAKLTVVGVDNGDGTCSLSTSNTTLPVAAQAGASGAFFSQSDLSDCVSASSPIGNTANDWSLETDAGIVLLCWNQTAQDVPVSTTLAKISYCFDVAPAGNLGTKARFAVSALGFTLTARNF